MATETYTFHGNEREDGLLYITSPDLPGFRLLLDASEADKAEEEIAAALEVFYPSYIAAKARAAAESFRPRLGTRRREAHGGGFNISAQFAFA